MLALCRRSEPNGFLIPQRRSGAAAWIIRAIVPVSADRLSAKAGRTDHDRVDVVGLLRVLQAIPHVLQDLAGVGRDCIGLRLRHVRHPLMVDARSVDGFLNVHPEIDDVENGL